MAAAIADATREPAFVVDLYEMSVVHTNPSAAYSFPELPAWLETVLMRPRRPRWVRAVHMPLLGSSLELLVVDCLEVGFDEAPEAPWALKWKLAPRHARVACGLVHALTDKEIAAELGLEPNTVRTYARQVLESAGVNNRGALIRAAIGASVRIGQRRGGDGA